MSYIQTNRVMSNKREFANIETSKDVGIPGAAKEPTLPVFIPMRIVRWIMYSALICLLLIPAMWDQKVRITISIALVLGHFASQLNALINKKQ